MSAPRPSSKPAGAEAAQAYRLLPSVDEVLQDLGSSAVPRDLLVTAIRTVCDEWRRRISAGELDAAGVREGVERGSLTAEVRASSWPGPGGGA